ncbi:MAG TPA: ABC transporter permease [Thermoanaerobaculia bacterium]|nr:ABC transporter permease [Thermoanaerobaculia bacterium]
MNPLSRTWRQRVLVAALTRRELVARYRGGLLGFFWSLVNPLLLLAVYATIFRVVFAPRTDVRPYAIFLFGGVLVWSFVSAGLIDTSLTFRANGPLLRKTPVFPEVFPAVAVAARLSHLVLGLPVLGAAIAFAAWRGSLAPGPAAFEFPIVLALLAATVWGFGLAISALALHFGDVRDLLANLLTLAFFLTPILYPIDSVPEKYRPLLRVNPFATFFAAIHETLFFFRPVAAFDWIWMAATAAVALLAGCYVFARLRDSIAEEA